MNKQPSNLEIHVHSVNGQVTIFAQNCAKTARELIEQMQPGRIFTQPYLAVSGCRSLTVFPSATVVRVDLVMRGFPDWPFHFGIHDWIELTEKDYRLRASGMPDASVPPQVVTSVYPEIELTNGERIYSEWEVYFQEEGFTQIDFGLLIRNFLSSPSMHARRLGGGAIVINPAHILRVQLRPARPEPPPNTWSADPLEEQLGV